VLHITLREWESVHVDGEAEIVVRRSRRNRVWLTVAAPDKTRVVRTGAKDRVPKPRGRRIDNTTAGG
jgi:sRNA-binding carbon storage regulator CsrA